jgi:membrane protease YdiL (CAAX protease family)
MPEIPNVETAQSEELLPQSSANEGLSSSAAVPNDNLYLEVLAVLAIGVLPSLSNALGFLAFPGSLSPYWVYVFEQSSQSICISFAVWYVIYRSGLPLDDFGLVRPGLLDFLLGAFLFIVGFTILAVSNEFLVKIGFQSAEVSYSVRGGGIDYLLMTIMYTTGAFGEELVTRAYLVTRMKQLTGSSFYAVALAAFAFASYHIYQGMLGFLSIFALGFVYGAIYLRVRRVWSFTLGHAFINVIHDLGRGT